MYSINWISATIGLGVAGLIFYLVRRDHLHTRYAMWWIPLAVIMAFLGLFPQLVDWIEDGIVKKEGETAGIMEEYEKYLLEPAQKQARLSPATNNSAP